MGSEDTLPKCMAPPVTFALLPKTALVERMDETLSDFADTWSLPLGVAHTALNLIDWNMERAEKTMMGEQVCLWWV